MPDDPKKGTLGLRSSPYTIEDEQVKGYESDVDRFLIMNFSKEKAYQLAKMPIAKARAFARIKSDKAYIRFGVSPAEINEANMLMAYAGRHSVDYARDVAVAQAGMRNNRQSSTDYNAVQAPPPKLNQEQPKNA